VSATGVARPPLRWINYMQEQAVLKGQLYTVDEIANMRREETLMSGISLRDTIIAIFNKNPDTLTRLFASPRGRDISLRYLDILRDSGLDPELVAQDLEKHAVCSHSIRLYRDFISYRDDVIERNYETRVNYIPAEYTAVGVATFPVEDPALFSPAFVKSVLFRRYGADTQTVAHAMVNFAANMHCPGVHLCQQLMKDTDAAELRGTYAGALYVATVLHEAGVDGV
jgi:hypothetical protein